LAELTDNRPLDGRSDSARTRRTLREVIGSAIPELRVVAEGFLMEVSQTDLLAVGGEGELVTIRIAEPGGDAAVLTRVLADLSWLRPRRADFLKLAPGLGIEPAAEPRALIVAREFGRETLSAVDNFPAATIALWRWQDLEATDRPSLRIESMAANQAGTTPPTETRSTLAVPTPGLPRRPSNNASPAPSPRRPERGGPLADPPSPSAFRTGLDEADLEPPPRPEVGVEYSPALATRRSR